MPKIFRIQKKDIKREKKMSVFNTNDNLIFEYPKYNPKELYRIYEESSLLAPNISAMEANIDGFGHYFSLQKIDIAPDDLLVWSRLFKEDNFICNFYGLKENGVNEENIKENIEEILLKRDLQKVIADSFFKNCTIDNSFIDLRRKTRVDLEVVGYAFWEIIRNSVDNRIQYIRHIPVENVIISKLSKHKYKKTRYFQLSKLTMEKRDIFDNVRTFAVKLNGGIKYFKEFGVKNVISSNTGKYFEDEEQFMKWKLKENQANEDDVPGNEILYFSLHSNGSSPYGLPRWIGTMPEVLGSRKASEFNFSWFTDDIIDSYFILVNGGTLTPATVDNLESELAGSKGVDNAHKIIILEATSEEGEKVPKVDIKPFKDKNINDAYWQKYDVRNEDKVGSMFRLPRIVRGITEGSYNRATAESALRQADEQVFSLERNTFDWVINKYIMPELDCNLIDFVSKGADTQDKEMLGDLIDKFTKSGILVPKEARSIIEQVFNIQLTEITENWIQYPIQLILAGLVALKENNTQEGKDIMAEIQNILSAKIQEKQGEKAQDLLKFLKE